MQYPDSYLSSVRFTVHEGNLNNARFETKFDKILSIGVFCHVGNLTQSFQKLAAFLKDDGKVFIHILTVRTPNNIASVFAHKHILPHGRFWNYDAVTSHNKALKTIKKWYFNGYNYSQTLANWLNNFDESLAIKNLNYGIIPAKLRRIRKFYLIRFVRNFASRDGKYNGNGQYLMVHI